MFSVHRDAVSCLRCILKPHLPQWTFWDFYVTCIRRERYFERLQARVSWDINVHFFCLIMRNTWMKLFLVEPENKRSDRGGELMWKLLERSCQELPTLSFVFSSVSDDGYSLYISPKAFSKTEHLWCMKELNSRQFWKSWWCGVVWCSLCHVVSHHLKDCLSALGAQFKSCYIFTCNPLRQSSCI